MYHVTGHALVLVPNRVLPVKRDMRWIQKLDARMLMSVLRGSRYTNVMRTHSFVSTQKAAIDVLNVLMDMYSKKNKGEEEDAHGSGGICITEKEAAEKEKEASRSLDTEDTENELKVDEENDTGAQKQVVPWTQKILKMSSKSTKKMIPV